MTTAPRQIEPLTERHRLLSRLDGPQTVVIRAPVGFGKTTLAAQWARRQRAEEKVAWVRVQAHGGDPGSFWASVVDALTDAGLPLPPLAQHRSPPALAERMISTAGRLTLIIDSFHNVTGNTLDQELFDLVGQAGGTRLIVCLRSHRHFAPRLFDDIESTVITAHELLFTAEETAELFAAFGLDPPTSCIELVQDAMGGWPEPTRAFARAVRDARPQPAEMGRIASAIATDYLRHRLLPELERPERLEFAIRTALPDEFTPPIVQVLTGDNSAKSQLEWLDGEGVVLTDIRDGEPVYRWPTAARQALLSEGERRFPKQLPELRARLARWYLADGQPAPALRLACAAGAHQLVVEVLEQGWRQLLLAHRDELHEALAATPLEVLATSARALAVRDLWLPDPDNRILSIATLPADEFDLANLGRSDHARDVLDTGLAVHTALRRRGRFDLAHTYASRLLHVAATARPARPESTIDLIPSVQLTAGQTLLLAGDLRGCPEPLQRAYEWAGDSTLDYLQPDAAASLALTHAVSGETRLAQAWLDRHAAAPTPSTWLEPTIAGKAAVARLLIYLDRLAIADARAVASAMPVADRIGADEWWAFRLVAHAQLALRTGPAGGLDLLAHARGRYDTWLTHTGIAAPLLAAAEADLLIALGRANQAHAILHRSRHDHPLLRVSRARLALLSGSPTAALNLATDSSWQRETTAGHRLDMLLIQAVAAHRVGDPATAMDTLQQAVDSARASGTLRAFTTVPRSDLSEIARALPAAAALLAEPPLGTAREAYPAAITQIRLTEREQRVLEQLATGLTVQQTATALVVSYNTVKSQISTLYRKLGTTRRADTIARARQWGLLGNDRNSTR